MSRTKMVWCVRFSPDGKTLATGARAEVVKLWDGATGAERSAFELPRPVGWANAVGRAR